MWLDSDNQISIYSWIEVIDTLSRVTLSLLAFTTGCLHDQKFHFSEHDPDPRATSAQWNKLEKTISSAYGKKQGWKHGNLVTPIK